MKKKIKTLSKLFILCATSALVFSGVTSNASTIVNDNENITVTDEFPEQNNNVLDGKYLSVSIKADKTSGGSYDEQTLRYEGTRIAGTYKYPEQITYDIIVKNYGTEDVENIKLTDTISKDLLNAVNKDSIVFDLEKGYYVTTSDGENVSITVEDDNDLSNSESTEQKSNAIVESSTEETAIEEQDLDKSLIINKLKSGDAIKIKLKMNAKQGVTSAKNLKNSVKISFDNNTILNSLLSLISGNSKDTSGNYYDEDLVNIGEYANVNPQMSVKMSTKNDDDDVSSNATFNAGDTVNFNIDISNTGDVPLFDVTLQDDASEQLSKVLEQNSSFNTTAIITDKNGNTSNSNLTIDGKIAVLSKLNTGETATIVFTGTIKKDAAESENLINRVTATAKWLNTDSGSTDYVQLDLDSENHVAESAINVVGVPEMNVSMAADKSTNEGQAIYNEGDVVEYEIVINNTGGKDLVNVNVKDVISDELKEIIDDYAFVINENTFTTSLGNKPNVSSVSKTEALIDSLKAGDSITLYFDAILKEGVSGVENISNIVNVTAFYDDLSNYPNTNLVQLPVDEENHSSEVLISVLGQPSLSMEINAITDTGVNDFKPGELISLNLYLKNTGNYDLVNLVASCNMDDTLSKSIESNTFITDSILTTTNGETATISGSIDSITIDKLSIGDSITIPFTLRLKEDAEEASNLKFGVQVIPSYTLNDSVQEFEAVENFTTINIVNDVEQQTTEDNGLAVAIKADKTTGKVLNTETGRYTAEAETQESSDNTSTQIGTPGTYKSGEKIDYTITVTNTKNVDLYNVRLENTISEELKNVLNGDQTFSLPENGSITSTNGSQIVIGVSNVSSTNKENLEQGDATTDLSTPVINVVNSSIENVSDTTQALTLSKLSAKDSVELHFTATISNTASNVNNALDSVQVTGAILNSSNALEQIPVTDSMSDNEAINVASLTSLRIAKLADKTTGVELVEGRYQGTKVTGEYGPSSVIKYKITVTNLGTADTANLVVTEQPSDQLKYLSEYGKFITKDSVKTTSGNDVNVSVNGLTATIDKLASGDSVDLEFEVKLKSDAMDALDIQNTISVVGNYVTGEQQYEIPKTDLMSDTDNISINKDVEPSGTETITKNNKDKSNKKDSSEVNQQNQSQKKDKSENADSKNSRTTGAKTGDQNHVLLWLTVFAGSIFIGYKAFKRVRN